jgi:hypothetical protein
MLSSADPPNDIDALEALLLASERLVRERDATITTVNFRHRCDVSQTSATPTIVWRPHQFGYAGT